MAITAFDGASSRPSPWASRIAVTAVHFFVLVLFLQNVQADAWGAILGFLFTGGEDIACLDAADANDTGTLDVSDAVSIVLLLFGGDNEPPDPGPPGCDEDSTEDPLDCGEFASCPE